MFRRLALGLFAATCIASEAAAFEPKDDLACMALNIYHEARGEGDVGMQAVAHVTMNRVHSDLFPDSVCEVVYQKSQFSWTNDGLSDKPDLNDEVERKSWLWAKLYAKLFVKKYYLVREKDYTHGSLFYHNKTVDPYWSKSYDRVATIGNHIFYVN